jgi:uncharacterized protein YbbC (DUF1343 family)
MVAVGDVARDRRTGVPVYSLYGSTFESLSPKARWLKGLDALVFDIQDVGARYYTYIYTMALSMKAAAKAKVPFFVLDRPNPIGLDLVQGMRAGSRTEQIPGAGHWVAYEAAEAFNAALARMLARETATA